MTDMQTATGRRGMRDLRTAVTARIRSKPTTEGQRYLDLYVLQRDRFRWYRLKHQAEKSIETIDKALMKIGFTPTFGEAGTPAITEALTTGPSAAAKRLGMAAKRRRSAA
jgi:hypothetical protein